MTSQIPAGYLASQYIRIQKLDLDTVEVLDPTLPKLCARLEAQDERSFCKKFPRTGQNIILNVKYVKLRSSVNYDSLENF